MITKSTLNKMGNCYGIYIIYRVKLVYIYNDSIDRNARNYRQIDLFILRILQAAAKKKLKKLVIGRD